MSTDRIAYLQTLVRDTELRALDAKAQLWEAIAQDSTRSISERNAARLEARRFRRVIDRMSATAEEIAG